MSKKDDALKLAREALEHISSHYMSLPKIGCMALAAVEEALAELPAQHQEPVAYLKTWHKDGVQHADIWQWEVGIEALKDGNHYLYTSPPASKPLTDEQIAKIASTPCAVVGSYVHTFARAIEAAHGIKGDA